MLGKLSPSPLLERRRERRRQLRLAEQAPLLGQVLAAHLRAGRSLHQALSDAPDDLPEPARAAVAAAARSLAVGTAPADALAGLGEGRDLHLLAAAVAVQARFGGELPVLLEQMAEAMHERAALVRSARVATAQARATGRLVSLMPVGGLAALWLIDRPALATLAESVFGWCALGLSAAMTAAGLVLIQRLATVRE
ncbi:MAG TPA: type II secretion system F family protein [Gaiellales bacterium]|jgi:tight adherence protein B|nr:type II secretion system F family protein [Gaiellales bacterium]